MRCTCLWQWCGLNYFEQGFLNHSASYEHNCPCYFSTIPKHATVKKNQQIYFCDRQCLLWKKSQMENGNFQSGTLVGFIKSLKLLLICPRMVYDLPMSGYHQPFKINWKDQYCSLFPLQCSNWMSIWQSRRIYVRLSV